MNKFWFILVLLVVIGGGFFWWKQSGGEMLGEKDGVVEIVAVGDVMLGRSVNTGMQKRKDFLWPFRETGNRLREADITFGNLENPLVINCPETDTGMRFCGELEAVKGLKFAGFDVISVANNHIFNYGKSGLEETVTALKEAKIAPVGNGYSHEMLVKGIRIKWLGFEDVDKRLKIDEITEVVSSFAKVFDSETQTRGATDDTLIISVHWGNEYTDKPSKRQREIGEALIDAGAKIVIGHHPHWVQPIERYKDGVIAYSLGNFVFDQMWSEKTREGIAVRFLVPKEGLIEYELLPVKIYDYGQPRWENGTSSSVI